MSFLPNFCDEGATVVWTRHREPPDRTPAVREWFGEAGFVEVGFEGPVHLGYVGVGASRWSGPAGRLNRGVSLFDWIGDPQPVR